MSVRMRTLAAEKLLTSIGLEELQHIKSMSRGMFPKYYDGCKIMSGAFRTVIVPDKGDFIIKIPKSRSHLVFCEEERNLSKKAQKAGLENYFANFLGKFEFWDIPCYMFEKFPVIMSSLDWDTIKQKARNNERWDDYCSIDIAPFVLNDKVWKKLKGFLHKHDVKDLHKHNVAYSKKRGHIVFIDYGGY